MVSSDGNQQGQVRECEGLEAQQLSTMIRESQVENAVTFLLHPKVVGSPDSQKLVFLQQKGLNQLEIKEAFKRFQQRREMQMFQYSNSNGYQSPPTSFLDISNYSTWARSAQIAIGIGMVAGVAYALKQWLSPMLRKWADQWVGKQQFQTEQEVVVEMKRATEAMQSVAIDLKSSLQQMSSMLASQQTNLQSQVVQLKEEMRSVSSPGGMLSAELMHRRRSYRDDQQGGSQSPHNSGGGGSSTPDQPPYSPAYNQVVEMLHRGETPSNVRNIDDRPPNPNQQLPTSMLQRPTKPWERRKSPEPNNVLSRSSGQVSPRSDSRAPDNGSSEAVSIQRLHSFDS
eukprot:TRINITY_DN13183_c1_g1_i5.p1 TRINITY_DN13183_c1_g1~~TRINITY_DN13183_c1_g1_i5.p1  ORF type:complete len:341 (-),score=30.94 TRINITY_DN13183_c1_g1_i5:243-1265(-)